MKLDVDYKNLLKKSSESVIFLAIVLKNQRIKGENSKIPNPELYFFQKSYALHFRSDNYLVLVLISISLTTLSTPLSLVLNELTHGGPKSRSLKIGSYIKP